MKTTFVNWSKIDYEDWEFVGANLIREKEQDRLEQCPHGNESEYYCDECNCYPEDAESDNCPMMNFAYPLNNNPSDEAIERVCKETNCTVVLNVNEDAYYLSLTGGGMDLSQSIALAYIICDGCIDWDMLNDVYISHNLCLSKEEYKLVMTELQRQLEINIANQQRKLEEIKEALK